MKHQGSSNNVKKILYVAVLLVSLALLLIFFFHSPTQQGEPQNPKLIDITYGNLYHYDNVVYIMENEQYTPYLVFPSDYDGNLLLIRSELTEEPVVYEDTNVFNAEGNYYPDSNVDKYLNDVFITRFTPALQDAILVSNVEVTTLDTINRGEYLRETEFVPRKIFLLSATELGIKNGMATEEGTAIKGLDQFPPSDPESYWLRTAYLWDDVHAWSFSEESTGQEAIGSPLPLRPAFVLSPDLVIIKKNDIVPDKQAFILKIDK